ncbi:helix-turn-helix transcriptional regulator [Lactobacillus kefiranofaciens]|uniref:helix-turn-helix domain-containing protein n=1 Tax=Lactobacillus kefiranofaciens TaxID=267818 RepID=UPI0024683A03|nr:helix-turn-helix transcriptional regulator [Lactobacillus kefiranofaciens]MDH5099771.1 helix-turn-helix transcriptional regulator [Lactobacillus kefiranofaciens]
MENRIKELRKKENVSQGDIAKALNVTPQAINQYETGRREPKLEMWQRLANYFNVSVAYLKGYTVYLYGNNKTYEYCPYWVNKCFEKDKAVTKSRIEKNHDKAVKRYENEINQAYNQLKDSIVGELTPEDGRSPLNSLNEPYSDFKEQIFTNIFKNYGKFKKQKIAEFERTNTIFNVRGNFYE